MWLQAGEHKTVFAQWNQKTKRSASMLECLTMLISHLNNQSLPLSTEHCAAASLLIKPQISCIYSDAAAGSVGLT